MDNTREKLIELIINTYMPIMRGNDVVGQFRIKEHEAKSIADHLIANGVTVQKWIPVSERLPDISDLDKEWSKTVLFRTTQGYILSGYRHIGRPQKSFYDDDWTTPYWLNESEEVEFEDDEVTHWMPLPEPPKGE